MSRRTGGAVVGERAPAGTATRLKPKSAIPFTLLIGYLLLDYGRPQELLPFLRILHLPGIVIGLLGISILVSGDFRLRGRQTALFLVLLAVMVIHGPIAVNNYWALMMFITMTMNFVVFLALTRYVDQPGKYDKLVNAWIGVHVFLALVGIAKKGRGIGGFLNDENDFCLALNMIFPLSFFLAMNATGKRRIWFLGITALYLFVIVLTQSRGGFVGLCASSFYCWLRSNRKFITAVVMGLLALVAVLVAPSTYWSEVRSITEEGASKGTGAERVYEWKIGWRMFLDNPILGVGQGNFPYVFRKYEVEAGHGEKGFHGRSVAGRAAHSIYFTMLPELGIVGTGLFLGMVFTALKDLKAIKTRAFSRARRAAGAGGGSGSRRGRFRPADPMSDREYALALALEGGLISFLVSGAFISVLYYPNFWILLGFIAALKAISDKESEAGAA